MLLGQFFARRGEEDSCCGLRIHGFDGGHCVDYGLAHEHHARAAAEGFIVHLFVRVVGVVAQLVQVVRDLGFFLCPLEECRWQARQRTSRGTG